MFCFEEFQSYCVHEFVYIWHDSMYDDANRWEFSHIDCFIQKAALKIFCVDD